MSEMVLNNVTASLDMMWRGMLGLFVVCGSIAVIMMIIARVTKKNKS
jgi:Mg2+/Co2+ transporter CorB